MANSSSATAFRPTPSRTALASTAPYAFCTRPGETMNAGARSGSNQSVATRTAGGVEEPIGQRFGRSKAGPPAHRRERERQRDREPTQLHGKLHQVDPRRAEQPSCDEIDDDHAGRGDGADPARQPRNHLQNRRRAEQLAGQNRQRDEPDEHARRPRGPIARSAIRGSRPASGSHSRCASAHSLGPAQNAKTSDPSPADAFHHQPPRPTL